MFLRPATPEDLERVYRDLRPESRRCMEVVVGDEWPLLASADWFSAVDAGDGRALAVGGVSRGPHLSNIATPWIMLRPGVPLGVVRLGVRWLRGMQEEYERLETLVDAEDEYAVKLVRWAGFRLDPNPRRNNLIQAVWRRDGEHL